MAVLRTSVNPPRFAWFRDTLEQRLGLAPADLQVLDAGCGGGLLAEQFAAIGCVVTGIDQSVPTLEAARDLGATPWRTFLDVTFPLIRPSVVGAGLLAMALSLDEFVVTWFNVGNEQTLPVVIWGLLRRGINPSINALATVVLVAMIVLVAVSNYLNRRKE